MAGGLVLQQRTEVEERCQPACMAWYPAAASQETFLVLANKHHKQRLVNLATKLCRKVVLSPPGSKYVSSMQLLGGDAGFFLLAIGNQLGLQRVPLTGSPADSCTALGNPRGLDCLLASPTGPHCFTVNKEDECLVQWAVDPAVLVAQSAQVGPDPCDAFLTRMPGGRQSKGPPNNINCRKYCLITHSLIVVHCQLLIDIGGNESKAVR